jgi:hypothetical protein
MRLLHIFENDRSHKIVTHQVRTKFFKNNNNNKKKKYLDV